MGLSPLLKSKVRYAALLLLVASSMNGCDWIKKNSASVMNSFFGDSSTSKKNPLPKNTKTRLPQNKNKTDITTETKQKEQSNSSAVTVTKSNRDNTTTDKIETKSVPVSKEEAKNTNREPLKNSFTIGGRPHFFASDDHFVYMQYPHGFYIFTKDLKPLAQTTLFSEPLTIKRFSKGSQHQLFIKEKGNTFEIIAFNEDDKKNFLEVQRSADLESNFIWVDEKTLILFDNKNIKITELTEADDLILIKQIDQPHVSDIMLHQSLLFISKDASLLVYDQDKSEITATLRIGRSFEFLGIQKIESSEKLWLTLFDENQQAIAFQSILLAKNGLSKIDDTQILTEPLFKPKLNNQSGIVVGQTLKDGVKNLQVYSLHYRKFLRGPLSVIPNPLSWDFSENFFNLTAENFTGTLSITLQDQVIQRAEDLEKYSGLNKNLPLAQAGSSPLIKDEYTTSTIHETDFLTSIRSISLIGPKRVFFVSENPEKTLQSFNRILDLKKQDQIVENFQRFQGAHFNSFQSTPLGIFALDGSGHLFYADVDLNQFTALPFQSGRIYRYKYLHHNQKDFLLIAYEANQKFYWGLLQLLSPSQVQPVQIHETNEAIFPITLGQDQLLLVSKNKIKLFNFDLITGLKTDDDEDDTNKQSAKNVKPLETVDTTELNWNPLSVTLSPNGQALIALTKNNNNEYELNIVNLLDIKQRSHFAVAGLDLQKFSGLSFLAQGQILVLPSDEGVLFYNLSDLTNVQLYKKGLSPTYSVDVAQNGQWICLAQGTAGLICGNPDL